VGLLIGKSDPVARFMSLALLAIGTFVTVDVTRLGYFGL